MSNEIVYRLEDGTFIDRKRMYFEVSRDGPKLVTRYMPVPEETIFVCAWPPEHKDWKELGKYRVIDRTYNADSNDMTIFVQLIAKEGPDERP